MRKMKMACYLGVDTGGTYTDAVILDEAAGRVLGKAKALTTRQDLALGIGAAVDAALAASGIGPQEVALVSLSTTLATNALVEGQGGRVALVSFGFDAADLTRAGLAEAMAGDPVIQLDGGHSHAGIEAQKPDLAGLEHALLALGDQAGIAGFAVAARFATRNPAHEIAARTLIRQLTGRPVTCSHELSAQLNGPKRALTAVLNARLIGMIDRLVGACERHLAARGITAPLMVVRGDGALIGAEMVRERPIETILSGPAASIVGARWLTGARDALVSDIGGTTTDVALLRDGLPEIDPQGAMVGGFRTMVEAVAMRTTGLGGDSEVHLAPDGLSLGLRLGPRRLLPVALLALEHGVMVHAALDRWLAASTPGEHDGRFVLPMTSDADPAAIAAGLSPREALVLARIAQPMPVTQALQSRLEGAALDRLVARGLVMLSGVTPSDASHVAGSLTAWDAAAAEKALALLARRRGGDGRRLSDGAPELAARIIAQLQAQTIDCLLEAALAADPRFAGQDPASLARHPLLRAGLNAAAAAPGASTGPSAVRPLQISAGLAVPVIGLGASAPSYYGAVGEALGCEMILPEHAGVANAIGAVAGQVSQRVSGLITSPAQGRYVVHFAAGPKAYGDRDQALEALERALRDQASARALAAGAVAPSLSVQRDIREAEIEGQRLFVEASVSVTAAGRPRIAHPRSDGGGGNEGGDGGGAMRAASRSAATE